MMNIKGYITVEVFGRDGKRRYWNRRRSRSFVEAFLSLLIAQCNPDDDVAGVTDTGGTNRTLAEAKESFDCSAPAGDATNGIVVGTGDTAVDVTDYAIETLIAHGVGAGQLSYSAVTYSALVISDPNVSFTLQRDFTNSSGGTITVKEEAIYCLTKDSGAAPRLFCIVRDVETTGVGVDDGENLRVTYTIQTST